MIIKLFISLELNIYKLLCHFFNRDFISKLKFIKNLP